MSDEKSAHRMQKIPNHFYSSGAHLGAIYTGDEENNKVSLQFGIHIVYKTVICMKNCNQKLTLV